jgi:PAS domain S-box-containing protein
MPEKYAPTHHWFMGRRYLTLTIVAVFIILSAITFFICYQQHTINTEQALKNDKSTASLLSLVLDERLKKIVSIMESYSNQSRLLRAVKDKNAEKARVHLISMTKNNPDIDILIITDRQGTLWAAYPKRPEVLGKNFAFRDWYKDVSKEWTSSISDVTLRVVAEKDRAVQISVPFFDETREVIGILLNTQRTVVLSNLIKQVPLEPGQDITVTDRKGQIVYSTRHVVEKEIRPYSFYPGMKKAMAANNKTVAFDDPDLGGKTRYISFAPLGNINWTVFVERDKHSIFLSGSTYFVRMTVIAFLMFLSIILFFFYLRNQVTAQQLLEQLQAEKIIRTGEEKLRSLSSRQEAILDAVPDIIMEVDNNKVYTWANLAGIEFFGEDVIGKEADFYFECKQDTYGTIRPLFNGAEDIIYLESWQRRKDGEKRLLAWWCRVLKDEVGNMTGALSSARDITERKHAEEQVLRQSKVLAAINRVFYETLMADSEEAVATTCLKVAQEITGSKFGFIGEITPAGLFTTITLSDPGWEACRIPETQGNVMIKDMVIRGIWGQVILKEQSLIVNDPLSYPDRVGIPEGHPPLTSFLGVPLKDQGKVIGIVAMANLESGYTAEHQYDVETICVAFVEAIRRKKAQEEIRILNVELEQRVMDRTDQLNAANKEMEAFSYSVSHDLRAPLRSIDGFSQALLEEYGNKLDDTGKTYLERARKATERMGFLIDDMLKLSRVSRAEFSHEAVDLSTMAQGIAEEHQKNNPERVVDVSVQEGVMTQGNRYMMKIVIENLMDNAWKFTGKTEHPWIEFGTTVRDGKTACFIRDNGAGFDMAYVNKLFGAFQRLHTTDDFPGTGIGLATVQRIIHRHGGQVWAEGEIGKGATFYFTLLS